MRLSKRTKILFVLTVAALFFASCSSAGDSPFDPTAGQEPGGADPAGSGGSGSEADLETAATASFTAFITGDDQSYFNQLSQSCRELQFAAVQNHLAGRRFRIDGAGIERAALGVSAVDINTFDGSTADVTLTLSGTSELFVETVSRHWIFEDDGWRLDECDEITPAQGGLQGIGTDRADPLVLGSVTDIDGWLVSLTFINLDAESDVVDFGGSVAPGGARLVVAQIGLDYTGAEPLVTLGDGLAFAMASGSTVYGEEASCETDNDIFVDLSAQVGPGDSLAPRWVCRVVPEADKIGRASCRERV